MKMDCVLYLITVIFIYVMWNEPSLNKMGKLLFFFDVAVLTLFLNHLILSLIAVVVPPVYKENLRFLHYCISVHELKYFWFISP